MTGQVAALPVQRIEDDPRKLSVTHVVVTCSHAKYRKNVRLTAYMADRASFAGYMLNMTDSDDLVIEEMPRLNRKREAHLQAQAAAQIATRSGQAWVFVEQFLAKHGLMLKEPVTA
jgi:hypothetical protein